MAEENTHSEETKTPEEVLKELKKNTVARDKYEELERKYNSLYEQTANGSFFAEEETDNGPTEEEKKAAYESAIKGIKSKEIRGSYAHMKALLEVDDYLTSHGKRSAFAPNSGDLTESDEAMCETMHDILKYCVDNSGGSDEVASAMFAQCLTAK